MTSDPYSDFRNFLYVVWKHLGLPEPTPVQYDIAYRLQHGPKRDIIQAFRGVGKSWITVAFVVWNLYRDPQKKILVVSASKSLADNFSTFCLQLINGMEMLAHLQPRDDQRNSKIQFDVGPALPSKDPSVKSVGITGQATGSRADIIVADDVEIPNNSMTQPMRDKLAEAVKEFDAILTPKPTSRIVFLGTPQCEQSLYNLLQDRGYLCCIWPARYPEGRRRESYGDRLAEMLREALDEKPALVGKTTDPRRFSDTDLMEREASYGRSGFALQFMLDTRLSDMERYPLRVSDLIVMDLDVDLAPEKVVWAGTQEYLLKDLPAIAFSGDHYHRPMSVVGQMIAYTGTVMFIDPSGRGKDETGYAITKMLNGQVFVLAVGGFKGGYDDSTLVALATLARDFKVNHVLIEANFGDGMFTKIIQPVFQRLHPVLLEEVKSSIQKEKRIIDTLEPVLNRHKLVLSRSVVLKDYQEVQESGQERAIHYSLIYQLTRICREKNALRHDDRLDALAGAVAYWLEALARDTDAAVRERKEQLIELELSKFLEYATGVTTLGDASGAEEYPLWVNP